MGLSGPGAAGPRGTPGHTAAGRGEASTQSADLGLPAPGLWPAQQAVSWLGLHLCCLPRQRSLWCRPGSCQHHQRGRGAIKATLGSSLRLILETEECPRCRRDRLGSPTHLSPSLCWVSGCPSWVFQMAAAQPARVSARCSPPCPQLSVSPLPFQGRRRDAQSSQALLLP